MNKQMMIGISIGALVATAGGAYALRDAAPKFATIIAVTPITAGMEREYAEVVSVVKKVDPSAPEFVDVTKVRTLTQAGQTQQVCENQVVTRQAPVQDTNQVAGTATGAVLGGVLGHQVGGGNGKKLATVAGAIAGGVIGKKVQERHQQNSTYQTTERVCSNVRGSDRVTGYEVSYNYDGRDNQIQMSYKPGNQLAVMNGQVVTDKYEANRLLSNKVPDSYDVYYTHNGLQDSMVMAQAPKIGAQYPMDNGQVITDKAGLAALEATQHKVVAYKVTYRINEAVDEVRMTEKPLGNTLPLDHGKLIMASGTTNNARM